MDDFNLICAVVVTYNIGSIYERNFLSLVDQVDKIIIVDNHSTAETRTTLVKIKNNYCDKVEVLFNESNLGLAHAQNQGLQIAIDQQFTWVMLLDHDSRLDSELIAQIKQAYCHMDPKQQDSVGILAPNIYDVNAQSFSSYVLPLLAIGFKRRHCVNCGTLSTLAVIASGSIIKVSALKKVGLMNEKLFIDAIDTEFCLRLISKHFSIYVVEKAILYHELGNRKTYQIGPVKIIPTFHSPLRRYYIYRNRIFVWKKYWNKVPSYILFEFMATINDLLRIVFFEDEKVPKLTQVCRGFGDGVRNKL